MGALLRVEGLWKRLGGRWVLRGVDLEVARGSLHVVVGPNGAGKTTLVKCVAGIYVPELGRVIVDGTDSTRAPPSERGLGVVLQGSPLLPVRTVYDHIALPLLSRGLKGREVHEAVVSVAERLSITHLLGEELADLSGGERQKVAIATALALRPRLLLLDEPFAHLDPRYRAELYEELHEMRRRDGLSVLVTTHIVDQLVHSADTVSVLVGGRVVEAGSPSELSSDPKNLYTALLFRHPLSAVIRLDPSRPLPEPLRRVLDGAAGYVVMVPYRSVRAAKGGRRDGVVVSVTEWDGDRVAYVRLDGAGGLYALVDGDVAPGDRVEVSVEGGVLAFSPEGSRVA